MNHCNILWGEKGVAGMAGIAGSKFIGRLSLILRSFGNLQTCKTCHYLP